MGSAVVLILATLILGGAIASVGDRVGTKVGKARLRIGNLRPRQTATVVTIATGTFISAATFGIIVGTDASLRQVILRSDEILRELTDARTDLDGTRTELAGVRDELLTAESARADIQQELERLQQTFNREQTRLKAQTKELRGEIEALNQERDALLTEREALQAEIQRRDRELAARETRIQAQDRELAKLETQRQALQAEIQGRDERIATLDRTIAARDERLQEREALLATTEAEIESLSRERDRLGNEVADLRGGNVALARNQVLVSSVVREAIGPELSAEAVDGLLREANRVALEALAPGVNNNRQIIQIPVEEVERLREFVADGSDYVVQVLSANNYVRGETLVRVFIAVLPNEELFAAGALLASVTVSSEQVKAAALQERLDLLLASTQFRVRRAGVIGRIQVGDPDFRLLSFIERLEQLDRPFETLEAIAAEAAFVSGPLQVELVARYRGEVVFSSDDTTLPPALEDDAASPLLDN